MGEEGCFSFAVALNEREKPVEAYRKREKDDHHYFIAVANSHVFVFSFLPHHAAGSGHEPARVLQPVLSPVRKQRSVCVCEDQRIVRIKGTHS